MVSAVSSIVSPRAALLLCGLFLCSTLASAGHLHDAAQDPLGSWESCMVLHVLGGDDLGATPAATANIPHKAPQLPPSAPVATPITRSVLCRIRAPPAPVV